MRKILPKRQLNTVMGKAVVLFLVARMCGLIVNCWWFPTLRPTETTTSPGTRSAPRTALLIPMRNESARVSSTVPGFVGAGFDKVIILDDESTDRSGQMVHDLLASTGTGAGAARLITGLPRPAGWVGKTWACAQLVAATDADILVFCDCDVTLQPGAAAAMLREMDRQRADVFSVLCRQQTGTWSERLLIPLITDVVLCFLPFGLLSAPVPAAAVASGALLALRRSTYDRIGGIEAFRGELVEDLAIARRCRRLGAKLGLALGGDLAQIRMYDSYRAVIAGMGRDLVPAVGDRRWVLPIGWAWHVIAYTAPAFLRHTSPWWGAAACAGIAERLILETKTGGRDWLAAAFISLSPVAAGPVVAQALRRRQTWKGQTYERRRRRLTDGIGV